MTDTTPKLGPELGLTYRSRARVRCRISRLILFIIYFTDSLTISVETIAGGNKYQAISIGGHRYIWVKYRRA